MNRNSELKLFTRPHPLRHRYTDCTLSNLWKSPNHFLERLYLTFRCQPRSPSCPRPRTPASPGLGADAPGSPQRLTATSRRATHLRWQARGSPRGREAARAPRRCWRRPGTAAALPVCAGRWRAGCLYGAWSLGPRESREQVGPRASAGTFPSPHSRWNGLSSPPRPTRGKLRPPVFQSPVVKPRSTPAGPRERRHKKLKCQEGGIRFLKS